MTRTSAIALMATVVAFGTPAFAANDCGSGYKNFVQKMGTLSTTVPEFDLAEAQRKGLAVYDSCKAGDALDTQGSWGLILKEAGTRGD